MQISTLISEQISERESDEIRRTVNQYLFTISGNYPECVTEPATVDTLSKKSEIGFEL